MTGITAILLTYNEEANVESCLDSIADLCDDVFVVDSGSTDATAGICRRYTQNIVTHPFVDNASQWAWALECLPIRTEWVLPLDADLVITGELKAQMRSAMRHPDPEMHGYYARHRYLFMGRRMRGFKPYSLRLFRYRSTTVERSELADSRFVVHGRTALLAGEVREENHKENRIDFWIDKHQVYSSRMAAEEVLRSLGRIEWSGAARLFGTPDQRMMWLKNRWYRLPLYVRPVLYFVYRYVVRGGFLDGIPGLVYHFLQAFWFRLLIDVKIAELRRSLTEGEWSGAALPPGRIRQP
jgi:glycosyltransferase involved in cell wall biosynthesis